MNCGGAIDRVAGPHTTLGVEFGVREARPGHPFVGTATMHRLDGVVSGDGYPVGAAETWARTNCPAPSVRSQATFVEFALVSNANSTKVWQRQSN